MRIIAGSQRGRRLIAPEGAATRPSADRVRQALFDMLAHAPWAAGSLHGASVLDVYAGSGALGLEALSRGAFDAVFIENDRAARAALDANIAACGMAARARVLAADARHPPPGTPRTLVLLDPPYGRDLIAPTLAALGAAGWLAENCLIAAELGRADPLPAALGPPLAERRHGAARLAIWRRRDRFSGDPTRQPPA